MSQTKAQLLGPVVGDVNYDSGTLFVDSTNNVVGVNTSSPISYNQDANNLVIADTGNCGITIAAGSTNASSIYFADGTAGTQQYQGIIYYSHLADRLHFHTNYAGSSEPRMVIDSNGNVGIGTHFPSSILDVRSSASDSGINLGRPNLTPTISLNNNGGQNSGRVIIRHNNSPVIEFRADGNGSYINTGAVGIGTDNPQARLHVTSSTIGSGSSSYGTAIKINGTYGSPNSNHGIGFSINNNSPSSGIYVSEINTSGSHLIFTTSTSYTTPTQVERLRISNNGDVGIGGITPNALLHVQKNSSDTDFTNETTPSAVSGVTIGNLATGAGTFTALTLSVSSGTATQNGSIIAKATGGGTAPEIHFTQRNSSTTVSRMMISSGGKITHSYDVIPNFAAQYGQLEITKNGASNIDPNWSYLSFHRTGQTGWQQGINGTSFVIANTSGGARDTLDGEKFRITASGNVGIGTDDPVQKLVIYDAGNPNILIKGGSYPALKYAGTDGTTDAEIYYGAGGGNDFVFHNYNSGPLSLNTNSSERIRIHGTGRIHFKAGSGGFDSNGYNDSTFPGAAFAFTLGGVGDAPASVDNYGMYCNFVGSSNNALSMTGLYLNTKHNTEGHAIGIHARYDRDWNSYARKIGGLFQAPVRTDRYATQSINPGGGTFINTGYGDPLLPGGNQPNGTTPTSYTYGDATALWGDAYRSDNDTNNNFVASVAVKATNRATHGSNRVGLMVATVAGADSTANKKSTQFVEYYEDSMFKRYYARNSRKEINAYYPIFVGSTGAPETIYNTNNAVYYLQKDAGFNQYNWYFFNAVGSSSARAGRCKIDITWTTGHASGVGYGTYDVLYRSNHSDSRITVVNFTRFNQYSSNGSFYGWTGTPSLDIYETSNTGNSAGFYLRVAGYMSANSGTYDGYVMHSIKIESTESDYNFSPQPSFAWVGTSTPSDAVGTATTISAPSH